MEEPHQFFSILFTFLQLIFSPQKGKQKFRTFLGQSIAFEKLSHAKWSVDDIDLKQPVIKEDSEEKRKNVAS